MNEKETEKELLRKLGEETIYTAKGHFKACDIRRNEISLTIWSCAGLNIISLIGVCPIIDKWIAAIGLLGTMALLIWNEGEGKHYRAKHREAAEKYLALHKEIRTCFYLSDCASDKVEDLSRSVSELDRSEKPEISLLARKWAKHAIEKKDPETDNWFIKQ